LVRLSMQVELEEEELCLNMKAVASFTLHFMHVMNIVRWNANTTGLQLNTTKIQGRHGLDAFFPFGNVADSMFLAGIAMTDRHVAPTASVRDIGLFVIWIEYLWLLPFLVRPIFDPSPGFGPGAGWFLLMLLYSRCSVITMNKLRLWPSAQLVLMLTAWILVYRFGHEMSGGEGYTWTTQGLGCVADPVRHGQDPGTKQCNPSEFMRVFGKIFINGGMQNEGMGMEFGYWIAYAKMFWLVAQYLFFFHYGSQIMRCVRASHRWLPTMPAAHLPLPRRVLTVAASVSVRLGLLVLFDFVWLWLQPDWRKPWFGHRVLMWPGVQLLVEPIGALIWMFCLYQCGVTFKLAGETILGYFIVGNFIPPNMYAASIIGREWLPLAEGCKLSPDSSGPSCEHTGAFAYPIQMFLTIGFVLGWIQVQSPFVQAVVISQFKCLAMAHKALKAFTDNKR